MPKVGGKPLPVKKAPLFKLPKPADKASTKSRAQDSPRRNANRKAPSSPAKQKKAPSRYVKEIIRMQFVELIHKYDAHQAKKRAEAMKAVRADLTKKFIRLYRGFRHKKYGEPMQQPESTNFIPSYGYGGLDADSLDNVQYPPEIQKQDDILKEQFRALEHQYNLKNKKEEIKENQDLEEIIEEDE